MKFKIDENLPVEVADLLVSVGHEAPTVREQGLSGKDDRRVADVCMEESRILVTLDLDFANIHAYPPQDYPGIIVLRVRQQDKAHVLAVLQRALPVLGREPLEHRLWIIDEVEVRIRGGEG
ncbi:MAG: DUF5615 family PIN-like protein [Anaerolineae bacterium]